MKETKLGRTKERSDAVPAVSLCGLRGVAGTALRLVRPRIAPLQSSSTDFALVLTGGASGSMLTILVLMETFDRE
jgi:hypothetical protein